MKNCPETRSLNKKLVEGRSRVAKELTPEEIAEFRRKFNGTPEERREVMETGLEQLKKLGLVTTDPLPSESVCGVQANDDLQSLRQDKAAAGNGSCPHPKSAVAQTLDAEKGSAAKGTGEPPKWLDHMDVVRYNANHRSGHETARAIGRFCIPDMMTKGELMQFCVGNARADLEEAVMGTLLSDNIMRTIFERLLKKRAAALRKEMANRGEICSRCRKPGCYPGEPPEGGLFKKFDEIFREGDPADKAAKGQTADGKGEEDFLARDLISERMAEDAEKPGRIGVTVHQFPGYGGKGVGPFTGSKKMRNAVRQSWGLKPISPTPVTEDHVQMPDPKKDGVMPEED